MSSMRRGRGIVAEESMVKDYELSGRSVWGLIEMNTKLDNANIDKMQVYGDKVLTEYKNLYFHMMNIRSRVGLRMAKDGGISFPINKITGTLWCELAFYITVEDASSLDELELILADFDFEKRIQSE